MQHLKQSLDISEQPNRCQGLATRQSALITKLGILEYLQNLSFNATITAYAVTLFFSYRAYLYFIYQPACQLALTPTNTRCMGPVFSHKKGDCCLNTNLLYQRMFILRAIACPLVIHSIHLSFYLKQRCQFNIPQTFHERC